MSKIKSLFAGFLNRVWRNPKENVKAGLKRACDEMPPKKRLTVVTVLLSVFLLAAFIVFGHACYKIGAKQAVRQLEFEQIHHLELPMPEPYYEKEALLEEAMSNELLDSAYEVAGTESED